MNPVVHFELVADDVKRAQDFYHKTFGWKLDTIPDMGYVMIETGKTDEKKHMPTEPGRINGGMMKKNEFAKSPIITIGVDDIHKAVMDVKTNGGVIIREPMKVGDVGTAAYFKDTEGNIIGLWKPNPM